MYHLATVVGILHGEIPGQGINILNADAPGLSGISFGFLKFDELGQIVFVERVGLAHIAAGVELVVPDFPCRRAFLKKEHYGFDARTLKGAAGAVEHGVEAAAFEQVAAQADGSVVGIGEKGVFDDDACPASGLQYLDKVLQKKECGLA